MNIPVLDEIGFWRTFGFYPFERGRSDREDFLPHMQEVIGTLVHEQQEASKAQLALSRTPPSDLRELRKWRREKERLSAAYSRADHRLGRALMLAEEFGYTVQRTGEQQPFRLQVV